MTMLSLTESMLIAQTHHLAADADRKMSLLEREIGRLKRVISRQDGIVAQQNEIIAMQEKQANADACSIAGYRAYVEHMRGVCDESALAAARDAYITANDAKAVELKSPHLAKKRLFPDPVKTSEAA
jgi:hypothetical protein